MDVGTLIRSAVTDPLVLNALYIGALLIVADVITGALKAWRTGTFQWVWLSTFVKQKVAGQYLTLLVIFILAKAVPDTSLPGLGDVNLLLTFATASFATFAASEIASIKGNLDSSPDAPPQGVTVVTTDTPAG